MTEKVIVVLDRERCEDYMESQRILGGELDWADEIRAALDTDRGTLARRLAEALDPSGWRLLDASDRDMATSEVEAVLDLLEGGQGNE